MSRMHLITVNNYMDEEVVWKPSVMQYLAWVPQVGAEGTPHLQAFVIWKKEQKASGARKHLSREDGATPWILECKGNSTTNRAYIVDDEKKTNQTEAVQHGTWLDLEPKQKKQGERTDITVCLKDIKENKLCEIDVAMQYPMLYQKYHKTIAIHVIVARRGMREEIKWPVKVKNWFTIQKPKAANKKRNFWVWGEAGLGKTPAVQGALKNTKTFMVGSSDKYRFERYDDEELILYDDTTPTMEEVLDVTNVWDLDKERVGGKRYSGGTWKRGQARTMIVLFNYPPPDEFMAVPQFTQRFNVIELKKDWFITEDKSRIPKPKKQQKLEPNQTILSALKIKS